MGGKYAFEKNVAVEGEVRQLEDRWKILADSFRDGKIAMAQYLDFELSFIESMLKGLMHLREIRAVAKSFPRTNFFLKRASLPTLMISIDDSGVLHVGLADGITPAIPGIEFTDVDLYIEGILGLSSRERFLKAYVRGAIKVHQLHKFREWAPYLLSKMLKIDRNVYHAIVYRSGQSVLSKPLGKNNC